VYKTNINEIFESWRKILELARRPDSDEYKLFLRIIFLGFFLVGAIGFAVGIIAYLIFSAFGGGL